MRCSSDEPETAQRGDDVDSDPSARLPLCRGPQSGCPDTAAGLPILPRLRVASRGQRIGEYTIDSVIATGGMGVVYRAVQQRPRRVVALKVMQQMRSSPAALRRFRHEGQILGRLRHPGIAQIYEAGTYPFISPEGDTEQLPFFAMEYVPRAKSIIRFANDHQLSRRQRLRLFAEVCEAVHHAHLKAIVHRDLKPANILVDAQGRVKIIDFGVARAMDPCLTTAMQTQAGQLLGTVQYMSPEQCEGDPTQLGAGSDVYALGIILFELLTGSLPYDVSTASVYEALSMIRDQPAPKLGSIERSLRGDLETIVAKALEKQRPRRYAFAGQFGQDVAHYLRGEPITARPPDVTYHLQLYARRHRGLVASVAAVITSLMMGFAAGSWYARSVEPLPAPSPIVERDLLSTPPAHVPPERTAAAGASVPDPRTLRVQDSMNSSAVRERSAPSDPGPQHSQQLR